MEQNDPEQLLQHYRDKLKQLKEIDEAAPRKEPLTEAERLAKVADFEVWFEHYFGRLNVDEMPVYALKAKLKALEGQERYEDAARYRDEVLKRKRVIIDDIEQPTSFEEQQKLEDWFCDPNLLNDNDQAK